MSDLNRDFNIFGTIIGQTGIIDISLTGAMAL